MRLANITKLGVVRLVLLSIVFATLESAATAQSLRSLSGTLPALVAELTGPRYCLQKPETDPRPYVDPGDHLAAIVRSARLLDRGEVAEAARLATKADFEVCEFNDTQAKKRYYLMREDLSRISEPRGWGSYLLDPDSKIPALVEAPHPVDDWDSAKVATLVFSQGAKGLLIAGSQRDKADVPDLIGSVFHQVHVAWTGPMGNVTAWQIHGFAKYKHKFPQDTQAVLSTGGGEVIDELVALDRKLGEKGVAGYVFNRLQPSSDLNKQVNGEVAGSRFRSLAATQNEQGKHLRGLGGSFVHVELERKIRADAEMRRQVSMAIAQAIAETHRPKTKKVATALN